jgi:hypothetical protein
MWEFIRTSRTIFYSVHYLTASVKKRENAAAIGAPSEEQSPHKKVQTYSLPTFIVENVFLGHASGNCGRIAQRGNYPEIRFSEANMRSGRVGHSEVILRSLTTISNGKS